MLHEECQRISIAAPEERMLTHISNFRPVKRTQDVIEIFSEVQKKIPSKLLLVGDGPDLSIAKKKAKDLGVYEKVLFLGNSVELEKILCYTDLFLLPSETESFGLAALEAMAAKSAVVSTNSGGLPEVNVHGVNGFLSDVGDVEDMSKNALFILKNSEILQQFKEAAYEHAHRFSLQEILPYYEKIYKDLDAIRDK